jgi:hypothetical protein
MTTTAAAALRRSFDDLFSRPVLEASGARVGALTVRVGGDPHVVRTAQIVGLHSGPQILSVPSASTSLLGIVGLRGVIVPVFDLAVLLGYPSAPSVTCLITAGAPQPVAFGIELFEAHVSIGADAGPALRIGDLMRRVVDIPSLLEMIRNPSHA